MITMQVSTMVASVTLALSLAPVTTPPDPRARAQFLRSAWQELQPRAQESRMAAPPSLHAPVQPGAADHTARLDAYNTILFARIVAGVHTPLRVDQDLDRLAQWAAFINFANNRLSHYQPKPAHFTEDEYALASQGSVQSNITFNFGYRTSLARMVEAQLLDDRENAYSVGHRRFLLNPRLRRVGLGYVANPTGLLSYGAVHASDQTGPRADLPPFVAWPSPVAFPTRFVRPGLPWSISLDPTRFARPIPGQVTIIVRSSNGETFHFRPTGAPRRTDYRPHVATICPQRFGTGPAITFTLPRQHRYATGQTYTVTVEGLTTRPRRQTNPQNQTSPQSTTDPENPMNPKSQDSRSRPVTLTYTTTLFDL